MSFKETIFFMLNSKKKSLQTELNNLFENILKRDEPISKQAFSKARSKINPNAFIELNDTINEAIYKIHDEYKLWNGYRISAIDGSILEIPDTELLKNKYGYIENQNCKVARAKAGCIFDLVNKIVLTSKIDKYKSSERAMAMQMISEMIPKSNQKDLILFDRGYPSAELFSFLIENNIDFLMRLPRTYSNAIKNVTTADQIIEIKHKQKSYKVRVIRFMLSASEEEILIISLFNENMTVEEFKEPYFMRWQVEIMFKIWKSIFQIHISKPVKIERFNCHLYGKLIALLLSTVVVFTYRDELYYKRGKQLSEYKAFSTVKSLLFNIKQALFNDEFTLLNLFQLINEIFLKNGIKSRRKGKKTSLDIIETIFEIFIIEKAVS